MLLQVQKNNKRKILIQQVYIYIIQYTKNSLKSSAGYNPHSPTTDINLYQISDHAVKIINNIGFF